MIRQGERGALAGAGAGGSRGGIQAARGSGGGAAGRREAGAPGLARSDPGVNEVQSERRRVPARARAAVRRLTAAPSAGAKEVLAMAAAAAAGRARCHVWRKWGLT